MKPWWALAFWVAAQGAQAGADPRQLVLLLEPAYGAEVGMSSAVKRECTGVESLLRAGIQETLAAKGFKLLPALPAAAAAPRPLQLIVKLTNVIALPGGSWSGSKHVTAHAVVKDGEESLAETVLSDESARGLSGNCSLLEHSAQGTGKRIAEWFVDGHAKDFAAEQTFDRAAPVALLVPVGFADDAVVPEAIRKDCAMDKALARSAQRYLSNYHREVVPVQDAAQAGIRPLLRLSIVEVTERSDGSATDAQTLRVQADLFEGGQQVGSAQHQASIKRGNVFSQVIRGVCPRMKLMAEQAGAKSARWVYFQKNGSRSAP